MPSDSKKRLALFDIDGTLIMDDGVSREAYVIALSEVYGVDMLDHYDFSGRTDPQITYLVLGEAGMEESKIETGLQRLWTRYLAELSKRVSAQRVRVLRGVESLLRALEAMPGMTVGLLTGNIEPGARIKLAPHDLNQFFRFGAFGSDSRDRTELPPIAVARAFELTGHRFEPEDVVVIGDTIYDIRCGVPHRATTIAVSTGRTSPELLRAERPDFLFDSLQPTDELLAAIGGR